MSQFSAEEWQRYQRHIQLGAFGVEGQAKLKAAHVLVVGAGGLGCPVAQYLGAAGIGHITLVDGDTVSRTNLHRQVLFGEADIGHSKARAAAARLRANNGTIRVDAIAEHLTVDNAGALVEAADLVLDCSDNFAVRYLVNDLCINTGKPWLFASVVQLSGQAALFTPAGACFRCLFPEPPRGVADCNAAGVLGTLPGIVGLIQANEALKYLAGLECPLDSQLLLIEGLDLQFRPIKLKQSATCPCQQGHIDMAASAQDYVFVCDAATSDPGSIDGEAFAQLRGQAGIMLVDVRSPQEHSGFNLGGINLPTGEDFVSRFRSHAADPQTPCILYCQSGKRSQDAAASLRKAGYRDIRNLAGGIGRWLEEKV